jgi:membrane protein DedA with SNARE-associated domain
VSGRFFWVTRKTLPFICGSAGIGLAVFLPMDALACIVWVSFWCLALYWGANPIEKFAQFLSSLF